MTYKNTTINTNTLRIKIVALVLLFAALVPALSLLIQRPAHAATLTDSYIRLDRLKVSTTNDNALVVFKVPAGNATSEDTVKVTFPSATYFTVAASPTINTTGCPAGTSALPGTLSIAGAGQVATITGVTNLTASTSYCFNIPTGVSTTATVVPAIPVSAGSATIATLTGATPDDSTSVGLATISDDSVVVSATVYPYLQFTLSGNTDSLTLDQTTIGNSASPRTVTVKTNGSKGWLGWVKSTNAGLLSSSASKTITSKGTINATPTTLAVGSEDYVLDADLTTDSATAGTGTVTIDPEYNGTGVNQGGTLNTNYNLFATANGPTDGDVVTLTLRSTISALTPAATDYTDTLIYVAAGDF